jgi:acyl-coenzyme A synthetase/AMP-(fatty) acid ligase
MTQQTAIPNVTVVPMRSIEEGPELPLPESIADDKVNIGQEEISFYLHTSGSTGRFEGI